MINLAVAFSWWSITRKTWRLSSAVAGSSLFQDAAFPPCQDEAARFSDDQYENSIYPWNKLLLLVIIGYHDYHGNIL